MLTSSLPPLQNAEPWQRSLAEIVAKVKKEIDVK